MSSQLDAIKARAGWALELDDVPRLVAAAEAVLELRPIANPNRTLDDWEEGYNEALDQAKHKIREALGETE